MACTINCVVTKMLTMYKRMVHIPEMLTMYKRMVQIPIQMVQKKAKTNGFFCLKWRGLDRLLLLILNGWSLSQPKLVDFFIYSYIFVFMNKCLLRNFLKK